MEYLYAEFYFLCVSPKKALKEKEIYCQYKERMDMMYSSATYAVQLYSTSIFAFSFPKCYTNMRRHSSSYLNKRGGKVRQKRTIFNSRIRIFWTAELVIKGGNSCSSCNIKWTCGENKAKNRVLLNLSLSAVENWNGKCFFVFRCS